MNPFVIATIVLSVTQTFFLINCWNRARSNRFCAEVQLTNEHTLEVRFRRITTDLCRLKQVMRGGSNPEAVLPDKFLHLDAQRSVLDTTVCMLVGQIPGARIEVFEVEIIEQEVEKLWNTYYATK